MLGQKIQDLVDQGRRHPLRFVRGNGSNFSHISFIGDLVLVVEVSPDQVNTIKELLDDFYLHSGQKN